MHGHLPVAGSSAALPGDGKGQALLINEHLTVGRCASLRPFFSGGRRALHLDRVVATTMADNAGSWRVLEKCGMRRVRTFYYPDVDPMPGGEHGGEHGDFVYELARGDWSRKNAAQLG